MRFFKHNFVGKKLYTTLCIVLALLSIFPSLSAAQDIRKDAISCSALYYIMTSLPAEDPRYAQSLMSLQQIFDSIYSAHENNISGNRVTKGQVRKLRDKKAKYFGLLYDKDQDAVVKEYMFCDQWRKIIANYFAKQNPMNLSSKDNNDPQKYVLSISGGPVRDDFVSSPNDKVIQIINSSFVHWTKMGRPTTTDLTEKLRNFIRQGAGQHNKLIQPTPKSGAADE